MGIKFECIPEAVLREMEFGQLDSTSARADDWGDRERDCGAEKTLNWPPINRWLSDLHSREA